MKKYRVREGSVIDYARYGFTGLVGGSLIGWLIVNTYPMTPL